MYLDCHGVRTCASGGLPLTPSESARCYEDEHIPDNHNQNRTET